MKKIIASLILLVSAGLTYGQENSVSLSGGYAFANIEESSTDVSGWRINGVYEFQPMGTQFAHGLSVGYISLTGESGSDVGNSTNDIGTIPIYYAPKFLFGGDSFKGFVKAAVGWQFSTLEKSGASNTISINDNGFALGAGAGAMFFFSERIFLNAEYEFLWLENSLFKEGYLSTASLGLGIRF